MKWTIASVKGYNFQFSFNTYAEALTWIREHYTRNTIIEDNIRPVKFGN
jgi:hypothetical protein